MLSFTHTIISLPFAVAMDNLWLIFLNALLFHFLADTLLHWNIYPWKFKRYPALLVAADIVGGLALAWYLMGNAFFTWPVWAAIAGGNIADVIQSLWDLTPLTKRSKIFPLMKPLFKWHSAIQLETHHVLHGLLWQAALVTLAILLIVK